VAPGSNNLTFKHLDKEDTLGQRTSYAPGTFCWADLGTTDVESARSFYTDLFGWESEDQETDSGLYIMFKQNGRPVVAIYEQGAERLTAGWNPTWVSYVSVDDADAVAARAGELGAEIIQDPFDVMEAGRMALAADPTGATFAIWQPGNHFGAGVVNDVGTMSWNELRTPDQKTASDFYSQLFGWNIDALPMGDGNDYIIVKVGDRSNGGITPMSHTDDDAAPQWTVYFTVQDINESADRVDHLGGNVLVTPFEAPNGKFSIVQDPQGAVFAFFEGEVAD
jgi:predicted enzyme related to lactoylglutathione lyase